MQPNAKIQVVYPLPWWDVQAAATFQSLPGPQLLAQQNTSNAQIRQSLGRNLSSCGATPICTDRLLLDVLPPGTLYGERLNQVDLRVSKTMRVGRVAIRPTVSIYNLLNANTILHVQQSIHGIVAGADCDPDRAVRGFWGAGGFLKPQRQRAAGQLRRTVTDGGGGLQ